VPKQHVGASGDPIRLVTMRAEDVDQRLTDAVVVLGDQYPHDVNVVTTAALRNPGRRILTWP
jgi:hypothetical protein